MRRHGHAFLFKVLSLVFRPAPGAAAGGVGQRRRRA